MVTATVLLNQAIYNASRQSSFTTDSISPTAGRFVIVTITQGGSTSSANTPTMSGCSMTFTQVSSFASGSDNTKRITVFRAVAVSPTTGALTIDFAGQGQIGMTCQFVQLTKINTTGSNGSNGIIQAVAEEVALVSTSKSITLSALAKASNVTYGTILNWGYGTTQTPGSGYTELAELVNTVGSMTQSQIRIPLGSTTVNWTFADANDGRTGAVALELNTVPDTGGLILTIF